MSTNNEKDLEILLGVLDTIHDFHSLDASAKSNCLISVVKNFINFVLYLKPTIRSAYPEYQDIFDKKKLSTVNTTNFKNAFYTFLLTKVPREGKPIIELNNIIINNFKLVFNLENINLSLIIDDNTILYLRTPLYYLIEAFNSHDDANFDIILNFLLNFLDITNTRRIKMRIKSNILSIIDNLTYPRTFFDDITHSNNLIAFKILNDDKLIIDESNVEGVAKYFEKPTRVLYVNNKNTALSFHIDKDLDIIEYLGAKYYIKDNLLCSEYNNIIFKFKRNLVGRDTVSDDSYGIYHLICSIIAIIHEFKIDYDNNNFENIIQNINETINILEEFNKYLVNNIKLLKKIGKRIFKIKNELDKIDLYKYLDLDEFLFLYDTIFNIIDIIKINKNILLNENILTEDEYIIITNLIKNIHIELIYRLNNLFSENTGLEENEFKEAGIKSLLLLKIIKHKDLDKMKNTIDVSDLENLLYKIFKDYYSSGRMNQFICFLLVGAKRYGDWVQALLGKRHYFFIQTSDYYCSYRSLLINGPVFINSKGPSDKDLNNIKVYNFREIPNFDESYIKNNFGIINKSGNRTEHKIDDNHNGLLYTREKYNDHIKTPGISRNYFYKYIKYKTKYNQLKNNW